MSPTGRYVTLLSEDKNNLSTRFVQYWIQFSSVRNCSKCMLQYIYI
ncbi:hypothetical protein TSAR_010376 [Trichomalopsis sarcophagae]|uniref:Uncharacterized protein n=1 Tax=Trichomalopsis sarcophagae TaxID=543379 RepID=A0A232FHB2_9HYME|nr:hypothetical protein TSAR_010376 [Trichomalopsis sarcophagae]